MTRRIRRNVATSISIPVALGVMLAQPPRVRAQVEEIGAIVAIATAAGEAYDKAKKVYDFLKAARDWNADNYDLSTPQLIDKAVAELTNVIIDVDVKNTLQQVRTAADHFRNANLCGNGDCASLWQSFDIEARNLLLSMEDAMAEKRYANALGGAYNILVPLYMAAHLTGHRWGIAPINGTLINDFILIGQRAMAVNYSLVGASSVTFPSGVKSPYTPPNEGRKASLLFDWAKSTSGNQCYGDDNICLTYLQTNATAQAVQRAQVALYSMLKDNAPNSNTIVDSRTQTTVIVDIDASYKENWQGYANAYWTSMQSVVNGQLLRDNICPDRYAIVGIWQIPKSWSMAFLCQAVPGYPNWIPGTSVSVRQPDKYSCSGQICNYEMVCGANDWLVGGGTGTQISCYHREDGQTILPAKGQCTAVDYKFVNMPPQGSFFAVPGGNYLVGYNMANYRDSNLTATYKYCAGLTTPGNLGSAMTQASIGSGVVFPQSFNVVAFGQISGLRDVQGPVAGGGAISANSFNINWLKSPVGVVASGQLSLTNGTVLGSIYHGSSETMSGVNYDPSTDYAGALLDFTTARTALRDMSQRLAQFIANGSTGMPWGNMVLKGTDPRLNIFLVEAADLAATHQITIDVPQSSTVIVNVSGKDVRLANAGFTNYAYTDRLLWNLYEATFFYATSVGMPGSVLAPFADASLGGNINGTVIAETINSTNEFHQSPFAHNWLVP